MKKKILVIGSFSDFGGREVEVNNMIVSLSCNYEINLFSTIPMTENSMAINDANFKWTSIYKELYNSSILLKGIALISKKLNKSNLPSYLLVSNKISSRFFNFHEKNLSILKKQINSASVVLFCGVFTNGYLKEIISYCKELNKPFILRTTGTISEIPKEIELSLAHINTILVHSYSNCVLLKKMGLDNLSVIDQTTSVERKLIKLIINQSNKLTFGYLGRFSQEKGIAELLDIFRELDEKLIIAGNGPLLKEVLVNCNDNLNLEYIGEIQSNKIDNFFEKIDILIIPSFEEAGPLVGIEAMAAGKIIFSTKVGAMEERLYNTKNDFWFDINEHKTFLEIYQRVKNISKEEIREIRESNRKRYHEKYSKQMLSKQYIKIVDNVLVRQIK